MERPAFAGFTIDNPNGAPSYGPVKIHLAARDGVGIVPRPTLTVVSPIRLSGPHVPASACASAHNGIPDEGPRQSRGHVQADRLQILLAVFTTHRHRERAEPTSLNIRRTRRQRWCERQRDPGQGLPLGPEVMSNCELT